MRISKGDLHGVCWKLAFCTMHMKADVKDGWDTLEIKTKKLKNDLEGSETPNCSARGMSTREFDHPAHQLEFAPGCDVIVEHGSLGIIQAHRGPALCDGAHALIVVHCRPAHRHGGKQASASDAW